MAKINYQTDSWGGDEGRHHLEIKMNGKTVMLDIEDGRIHINGLYVRVDKVACNAVDVFIEDDNDSPNIAVSGGGTPYTPRARSVEQSA